MFGIPNWLQKTKTAYLTEDIMHLLLGDGLGVLVDGITKIRCVHDRKKNGREEGKNHQGDEKAQGTKRYAFLQHKSV